MLVSAGIRDILVITAPADRAQFQRLLDDGSRWGLNLAYAVQPRPEGIAQALLLAADFIADQPLALVLGDNIFHGTGLAGLHRPDGAHIFACPVADPGRYGVVELDDTGKILSLEEKPEHPRSTYAVPGLYLYEADVVDVAAGLRPSARGELEITAVNQAYLRQGRLHVTLLERGSVWLDTGTFRSLAQASEYVRVVEDCQGVKIGCVEEAAWRLGFITDARVRDLAAPLLSSGYGEYLLRLLADPRASSRP